MQIELEHVEMACDWAERAREQAAPIGGVDRRYDQTKWDCDTSCCIWSAAHLLATGEPANGGPPSEWVGTSSKHEMAAAVMSVGDARPGDVRAALRGELLPDASPYVRGAVAERATLPEELVERLAADASPYVRGAVAERRRQREED